jgi:hypothetical protein
MDDTEAASSPDRGLSNAHNCTPDAARPEQGRAAVCTVWRGGSLVEFESVKDDDEKSTGKAAELMGKRMGGGTRGKVKGFSVASRRRLLKLFARLRSNALPLFVTLTLPDGVAHDGQTLKGKYFRRFKARLSRKFPGAAFIWRMEVAKRKSGEQIGEPVPHVHLVLWGVLLAPGLREWLSLAWYESVGSHDPKHLAAGTQVSAAKGARQVKAYASKLYAAKDTDDGTIDEQGRSWGILQERLLPWADAVMRLLSPGEAARALRTLRRYFKAAVRGRGRRRGKVRSVLRWCFVDNSDRWAALLEGGALGG